jgi:hypothetical protein
MLHKHYTGERELTQEIHRLENHVRHLRTGDESAYEKALIRTYEHTLKRHRSRLAELRAN